MRNTRSAIFLFVCWLSFTATRTFAADDSTTFVPKQIELPSVRNGDWVQWQGIGNLEGVLAHRERITAMVANKNELWVATSWGRLLTYADGNWTLQASLKGLQITGIAVKSPDMLWLSTSDGIRRLDQTETKSWKVTSSLVYYEGNPSFVSGGYIPGENGVRRWGYVDDIYIPSQEKSSSPFVISQEHGLFCGTHFGHVWHHFLHHYWGTNSDWLDTRELVPHRRPTRIVEDHDGHLWIGTEWDGLVRLNKHSRKSSNRNPENSTKDGREFSFFDSDEVGCDFDRVVDLTVSEETGIWAVLSSRNSSSHVARYDGNSWTTLTLDEELVPACIVESKPNEVWIGVLEPHKRQGIRKVNWETQQVEPVSGPDHGIRNIVKLPDGRILAASWWMLFETKNN